MVANFTVFEKEVFKDSDQKYEFPDVSCKYQFCCPDVTFSVRKFEDINNPMIHDRFDTKPFKNEIQSLPANSNYLKIPTSSFDTLEFYIYAHDKILDRMIISSKITYKFKFDCNNDIITLKDN